jgi:hypothetical protein
MYSYGQPSSEGGPTEGTPNTFIWGFRAVGGSPLIPPTLTLTPDAAASAVGGAHGVTATLRASDGAAVAGAEIVFLVGGANSAAGAGTTNGDGQAGFSYTGANAGTDTITACLDSNNNGGCDPGEVGDSASKTWEAPTQPPVIEPPVPPQPELGKTFVAGKVSGTIRIRGRNGRFRTLGAAEEIPMGTTVDATKGRVRLTSAANARGATQTADFYRGQFKVTQTRGRRPVTQLALNARLRCGSGRASTAQRRRKVRRLWGDGKGSFRTRGRHGAATVRGTIWLTEDRCTTTRFRVRRGSITVRDFVKKRNKVVRRGRSYVVRKKR